MNSTIYHKQGCTHQRGPKWRTTGAKFGHAGTMQRAETAHEIPRQSRLCFGWQGPSAANGSTDVLKRGLLAHIGDEGHV